VGTDPATANGADQSPTAAPTAQLGAPGPALPVRSVPGSAIDARGKLARLAEMVTEVGGILRELSQVPLAIRSQEALMCSVNEPAAPARLLTAEDLAA